MQEQRPGSWGIVLRAKSPTQTLCSGGEEAFNHQGSADAEVARVVDVQHADGRPANRRAPNEPGAPPVKVLRPVILTWVEEWHQVAGHEITTRDVRPLGSVAPQAAQASI